MFDRKELLKATQTKRVIFFLTSDLFLSILSLFLAYQLRFNFSVPQQYWQGFWKIFFLLVGLKILFLFLFKMYHFSWKFFGLYEAKRVFLAISSAYLTAAIVIALFYDFFIPFPRSALIIDFILSLFFLIGIRSLKRILIESTSHAAFKTAALYGVDHAKELIDAMHRGDLAYKIVAVVDEERQGSRIGGVEVVGEESFLQRFLPHTLIITKETEPKELDRLLERFKGIKEFRHYSLTSRQIEAIRIEDLLARKPKDLDQEQIRSFVKDKRVLITGAGGSIGSELVAQCERYGAKEIIAVEQSEFGLYLLNEKHPKITPVLCDVTQKEEFEKVVARHKPHIIFHAAAYKHVPLAELNPHATVKNNILGTKVVLDAAIANEVPHFILISTDKAVNPTNIMGASKRVCELYAQNVDPKKTKIGAVRFGNVLGSSGSVIPKFKAQILAGGPVTVTHPQIRRYFMLTSEACQLVLQAGSLAREQEIFILDMGEPVKIVDLAKKMMELMGKEVPIEFVGLRPGEKLYEELLIEGAEKGTKYESIYVAKATKIERAWLDEMIQKLLAATEKPQILKFLKAIVKEFNHQDLR